ncbi:glycosyltransferase family 4 protein [Flavobacterium aestuarii]|uniref:glycosyltransferase family 4 protein n=1 Tax=Flavobacterium aestuarii TaxID=3149227 RepID=UPI0032B495EA
MKAVFIHDHYFVLNEQENLVYDGSGGVFDYKLWNRYLAIFDWLTVVGRKTDKLPNKLIVSSAENVVFRLIDDLKSGKDRFIKQNIVKEKLKKIIQEVDFAIIRVPSTLGYLAQSVCEDIKKPYILEIVACPWDAYWNYGKITAKLMAPFEWWKLKSVANKSPACVYVTKEFLQSRYPTKGKSIAISNVRIENVINPEIAETFYRTTSQNEGEFRIGLIGSFHVKYKGHLEALRALKKISDKKQIPNVKLYLVGTGDSQWVLNLAKKLKIEDKVEIVGTLKAGEEGILPFLDQIDLYIHPSKQEGLPRVVIEAMSRGRLALGSSAAGIPELLRDSFLHKPGDWRKLSFDIVNIYNSRENWETISKQNIDKACEYIEEVLQQRRKDFFRNEINKFRK